MSLVLDNMATIRAADKSARVNGYYIYRTTDSRATVSAKDYFKDGYTLIPDTDSATQVSSNSQDCSGKFYVGDIIRVQEVDSSDRPLDDYEVVVVDVSTGASSNVYTEILMPGEMVAIGSLSDVSTSSNTDIVFGAEVELVKATTYLGGTITSSDATITIKEDSSSGTAVDGGSITVAQSGSAAGDKDTANPYANRTATTFNVATDGGSTGEQTLDIVLRGMPTEGKVELVTIQVPDISTANSAATIACPYSGTISKIQSTLQGAISSSDATVTTKIGTPSGGTSITSGSLTIAQSGSAAGDIDEATPSGNNVVGEEELLSAISDGGSTDAAALYVTFYILRS